MPSKSVARKNMKRSKLRKRTSRRTRINKRQNTKRRRLNKRQNTKRRINKRQNTKRRRINKRQNTKRRRLNKRQNTKRKFNGGSSQGRRRVRREDQTGEVDESFNEFDQYQINRKFRNRLKKKDPRGAPNNPISILDERVVNFSDGVVEEDFRVGDPGEARIKATNDFKKIELDTVVTLMHTFNKHSDVMAKSWKNYVNESVRNPEVQGWAHGLYKGVIGEEKLSSLGEEVMRMESDLPRLIEEELVYPQTIGEYLYDNYLRADLPL